MSTHSKYTHNASGLTLVELMVTIVLIGIISATFYAMFHHTINNYLGLQKQASSFTQLSTQSARLISVLRGATDISEANDQSLTLYAYFYPADQYVSLLRYYVVTENGQTQLRADLTPMSANPPIGTQLTAQKRTFTIIENLYMPSGTKFFEYKGANDVALTTPISELRTIKAIQVNLATQVDGNNQRMSVKASLRNRKTNL